MLTSLRPTSAEFGGLRPSVAQRVHHNEFPQSTRTMLFDSLNSRGIDNQADLGTKGLPWETLFKQCSVGTVQYSVCAAQAVQRSHRSRAAFIQYSTSLVQYSAFSTVQRSYSAGQRLYSTVQRSYSTVQLSRGTAQRAYSVVQRSCSTEQQRARTVRWCVCVQCSTASVQCSAALAQCTASLVLFSAASIALNSGGPFLREVVGKSAGRAPEGQRASELLHADMMRWVRSWGEAL